MSPYATEETTLILLKPDCIRKNLSGSVLKRFLEEGFRIRGMKMMQLEDALLEDHYTHIRDLVVNGEAIYPILAEFMTSSPIIALALSGPGVTLRVRELLGPTNSQEAAKGTIRGDYGTDKMMNICHASDSKESALIELKRFFKPEELFDYMS